ncbi:DNA circularization N-terminal domain-containing protein [Nitrobacter sp.]|uniref:DNA circularization N-terminal domain-containing protein n=1 Tax=Nitrobacter sp. TaxID=29420 RepID=UPI003F64EAE2
MATIARDWLKTLWAASFKGVPFKVERDAEGAGRRIRVHEFPMRDDPYLEDLGEARRDFDVLAYVASDSADSDAAALIAVCAARGAGVLVLPSHGPVTVRCLTADRRRDKDRHGYIAIGMRMVREGFASALASSAMLANLTFAAADTAAVAAGVAFSSSVKVAAQPGFVAAAAVSAVQDDLAALEAVRTTEQVDPPASAAQRNAIQAAFDAAPEAIASDPAVVAQTIVTIARALGDAMRPADAVRAFDGLSQDAPVTRPQGRTASALTASGNIAAADLTLRIAALTAYCEAIVRTPLADRPSAITLRANVADYIEAELDRLTSDQIDLYRAMTALRDATIDFLSRAILDLAPVVTVEANLSMPSLFWAWRLYADPSRSSELVGRNRVVHPSFMPATFEALAQ